MFNLIGKRNTCNFTLKICLYGLGPNFGTHNMLSLKNKSKIVFLNCSICKKKTELVPDSSQPNDQPDLNTNCLN